MTTDLAEKLSSLPGRRSRPGPPCQVSVTLQKLRGDDLAAADMLEQVIDNPFALASDIATLLADNGHDLSVQSIRRHRKRSQPNGCRCPR